MLSLITSAGGNISSWSLVAVFVLLIAFGGLIPRWQHKQALRDKDEQINEFRAIHAADLERSNLQMHQVTRLLDATETTTHLINTIQREVNRGNEWEIPGQQYHIESPRTVSPNHTHRPAAPESRVNDSSRPSAPLDARSLQYLLSVSAENAAELRILRSQLQTSHSNSLHIPPVEEESAIESPDIGAFFERTHGEERDSREHWDGTDDLYGAGPDLFPQRSDDY